MLHRDCCVRFPAQGADPAVESKFGHTAVTWAAVCGFDLVAVELLSHHGKGTGTEGSSVAALTRVTRKESKSALHYAAVNGNTGVVLLLLDRVRDTLLRDRFVEKCVHCGKSGPAIGACHVMLGDAVSMDALP